MKYILLIVLSCSSLLTMAQKVKIPAGTLIGVELMENINSKLSDTGDVVYARVIDDVVIDGKVVIRKGALAHGKVKELERSGRVGKGGALKFTMNNVTAVDGQKVGIIRDNMGSKGRTRGGAVVAHTILWGPLGLLARGRQANALKGTAYDIETRIETVINLSKATSEKVEHWEDTRNTRTPKKVYRVNLAKGKTKESFSFMSPGLSYSAEVHIVRINDFVLPRPIKASSMGDKGKINFDWWSVFKYCQPEENRIYYEFKDGSRTERSSIRIQTKWKLG